VELTSELVDGSASKAFLFPGKKGRTTISARQQMEERKNVLELNSDLLKLLFALRYGFLSFMIIAHLHKTRLWRL
jgi:hypothetical protein